MGIEERLAALGLALPEPGAPLAAALLLGGAVGSALAEPAHWLRRAGATAARLCAGT